MSAKHTKGPWKAHPIQYGGLPHAPVMAKTLLAKVYSEAFGDHDECEANARRIVACVNACEGFSIEELEGADLFADSIRTDTTIRELEAQRDELLEALKKFTAVMDGCANWPDTTCTQVKLGDIANYARATIAKAEGGVV